MLRKFFLVLAFMCISPVSSMGKPDMTQMINKLNQGVVKIETTTIHSAYSYSGLSYGTGFLIDKAKGLFLTNSYVIIPGSVCRYTVKFADGKEAKAKLKYYDPWQDFAFLQIDPKDIPAQTEALKIKPSAVIENEEVFIIGNNGGFEYSFLSGRVASQFENTGHFPTQSFRITLNNAPGSSGSPVINMQGEVIGIIHSGNDRSSASALPMDYVMDSLTFLNQQQVPPRNHVGAIVEYESLDKMVKYGHLPTTFADEYTRKFPNARRRILRVRTVMKGSPAEGIFLPGDVIISLNGNPIGPNLYIMDKLLNASAQEAIFEVYRHGQKISVTSKTFDLHANKISKLFIAGGATFYPSDDFMCLKAGIKPGSVMVTNIQRGGSFYYAPVPVIPETDKVLMQIQSINQSPIASLHDIIQLFTSFKGETQLTFQYANFGYCFGYSRSLLVNQSPVIGEVTYNPLDAESMTFEFDHNLMDWVKR